MFVITSNSLSVACCFLAMLCWGSWANTQKLTAQSVPTTIFYRDYTYGILILSLLLAFTLGSIGESGRPFLTDIKQGTSQNMLYALAGGFLFTIANILIVAGIELTGLSVAAPVGIGVALILGAFVKYLLSPVGDTGLLVGGGLAILLAIIFGVMASRAKQLPRQRSTLGLRASLAGGFPMGFFFYFVAKSMTVDFENPNHGSLTPYTALVIFALGIVVSTPLFLPVLRRLAGKPADGDIFYADVSRRNHRIGILGGMVWCLGMASSLLASGAAGYAISYGLGQGAAIIAVLWGVFIWHEFRGAPPQSGRYLMLMGVCYVLGVLLIIAAR